MRLSAIWAKTARCARCCILTGSLFCLATGVAMAAVEYTYENDGKTYVANVTSAETAISDEAIAVLDANEITNFAVRGSARLLVNKGSVFTGDVYVATGIRFSAVNALGSGPGRIYITKSKLATGQGGASASKLVSTIEKEVVFDCGTAWDQSTGIAGWSGTSVFKEKVTFTDRNLNLYPYLDSRIVFEGGLEGSGGIPVREASGGTVVFTNKPARLSSGYPISIQSVTGVDPSGFSQHFVFAVAGNELKRFFHPTEANRFVTGELKTTVDWAFDDSTMPVHFAHDSRWDLCGTSQRIGYLDFTCTSGSPSVVTNSLVAPATLYVTQTANATPAVVFGGNLSVDFSGNKITTIDHAMTAKGAVTVNAGTLAFTENGSWANATNVTVKGAAKITVANPLAFGRNANVNLAANSSLEIASGVRVSVKTLTIGGMRQRAGEYAFGSGTLSTGPRGCIISIH